MMLVRVAQRKSLHLHQIRSINSYIDKFGNTICSVNNDEIININDVVNTTPKGKAILLKNVDGVTINRYNCNLSQVTNSQTEHNMKFARYQCNSNKSAVYLIRNWSKCPELCYGSFIAGGVNVLVEHDGYHYVLLMKDKTRYYLTCPGGTATMSDINGNVNIGVRELLEETTSESFNGINLSHLKLDKLCKFYFKSKFFDIDDIPDTYTMNTFYTSTKDTSNENVSSYLSMLFQPKNLCDEHCYKLNYNNHDETEFVYALNLPNYSHVNNEEDLNRLLWIFQREERQIVKTYNHPVTYLHATMSQLNFSNQIGILNKQSPTIITNTTAFNFPNNLVKLELFPNQKE